MSSISVYSSTPRTVFRGVKDGSATVINMSVPDLPIHLPLFASLAPWGEENKARFVNAAGLELLYGSAVLDVNSPFYTHQSAFIQTNFEAGASAMFLRLVSPEAKQASIRFGIDIVADKLVEYERNDDGSFKLDAEGDKKPTGDTYDGFRVQIRKVEVPTLGSQFDFGLGAVSDGNMLSEDDGSTSEFYPFFDATARFRGAHGNNLGLRFVAPTVASTDPANENTANRVGSFLYRIQQTQRSNEFSTPMIVMTPDGRNYLDFSFKPNAKDINTNTVYDARKVIINGFEGKTPETFAGWGNMERIHTYDNHLQTVLELLATAEEGITGDAIDPNMINFMTGVDINGIPYQSFVVEGPEEGGLMITENSTHYFLGGDDGEVSNAKYNELVSDMLDNLAGFQVPLYDIAAYPFSSMWDSGFPLDVKQKFTAMHNLRPDVAIFSCTQDILEPLNKASMDSSIGIAIKSKFRAQQESSEFGTKALRFFCQTGAGYLLNSEYDGIVPMLEDTLSKVANYMGAGNGEMSVAQAFGRGSQNTITRYRDHNVVTRPDGARNTDWSNGLTYSESFDIDRLFVAGYQSMYEQQNSVLASMISMIILCNLTRTGHVVWRNFTGDSQLTDEEFFAAVEQDFIDRTEGKFDGRAKIVPRAYKTKLDDDLGFSYHLDVDAGFENMRTVQHLAIIARRRRDME